MHVDRRRIRKGMVQKLDRINSDRQSGSDQLGSTRIVSDHEKNIKLNEIETFTHLKVKYRLSFSLNLHPSTKMIVSVIKNVNIFLFFTASDVFFCEKAKRAR